MKREFAYPIECAVNGREEAVQARAQLPGAQGTELHEQPSESSLRELLNAGPDALVVTTTSGWVLYSNPAARRLSGVVAEPGTLLTLPRATGGANAAEFSLMDRTGCERTFALSATPMHWNGEPAQLLVLRDVGERRAAEEALMLTRRAMEASAHGIMILDARDQQQPLIYVNPSFERITGYSRGEVLGRNCGFLHGSDREQPQLQQLRDALACGNSAHVVLRSYRKDGTLFWNDLAVSPVRNAVGAVTHFVGIQNDVTDRLRHEAELLWRSTHDALTGLPNSAQLLEHLREMLEPPLRGPRSPAALLIDLDHFKEVNDSLGHEIGDLMLLEVVERLKCCLVEGQTLGRQSGSEFLVLLPDASSDQVMRLADAILRAVSKPYQLAEQTVYCSCSVGVAVAEPSLVEAMQLVRHASFATHAAKRAGRHAVRLYSADMAQQVCERLEMRARLQEAIARREFDVHYQPQVDLNHGRISGVEALVRWRHPQIGDISPMRFIPVAEETGQIVAIGDWVMEQACAQHRRWIEAGLVDCSIAVNVSGVQFQCDGFVETVADILERTGLPAKRLELELTESVTMDTGERTLDTLRRLRALGVTLSIDDFGTGFSSLGYLKRLPIDKVKIDRSFIKDITHDSDDAAITLSVIAIAHHLRLRVVAEGVETAAQHAYLRRHLCDGVQGFFISPPLPAARFEAFVAGFRPPASPTSDEAASQPTLLLVDDEPNILRALTRTLRRDGYRILTAGCATEAFEILAQNDVQVVVSDQRMPQMCGTDFLSEVKMLYPHTVRLVLSGYTDLKSVTDAVNRGAIYRFLTKPWEDELLRAHIKEALLHQQRLHPGGT